MRPIKSISLSCLMLVSFASPVLPAASSPELVVQQYMAALRDEGMPAISRFIHPDDLKRFKDMLMPMVRRDATQKSEVIHGLFGAEATLASVEAMSSIDFMNSFMRVAGEQLKDAKFGDVEVLGTVRETYTVHVVARTGTSIKGVNVKSMEVISVKRAGADWKLLLSAELEGMAAALSAM
jgi:hypothetical protein